MEVVVDNHGHIKPLVAFLMVGFKSAYEWFGSALNIYSTGMSLVITTCTAIIVVITAYQKLEPYVRAWYRAYQRRRNKNI